MKRLFYVAPQEYKATVSSVCIQKDEAKEAAIINFCAYPIHSHPQPLIPPLSNLAKAPRHETQQERTQSTSYDIHF